jgi:DNA modification methylase
MENTFREKIDGPKRKLRVHKKETMSETVHQLSEDIRLTICDALKHTITEKCTMIYFDPPFNSDREYKLTCDSDLGFSDKWTDANYEEFIRRMVDKLYSDLTNDGTLFFHISSSCMFIPERILRAKFKFVEPIFWKKCRSKNNVKNKLGSTIDIIFKCNKIAKPKFNVVFQEKNAEYLANSFNNKDDFDNYALGHLVVEKTKKGHMYSVTIDNKTFAPASGWRIKEPELRELIAQNRVHFPTKPGANLYKKIYLSENPGKPCTDLWDDIHSISQGSEIRKYPTAKPVKLLERLIAISTNEGDVVYDPMCGSGTTAGACANLKRKCILNDINIDVLPIVQSRFTGEST